MPIEDIEHCFPTFSPDGQELFWMTLKRGSKPKIMHLNEIDGKYLFIGRFIEGEDGTDAFFWMDSGIIDSLREAGPR